MPLGEDLQADFHLCLLGLICSLIFGKQEHMSDKHTYTSISVTLLSFFVVPSVSYDRKCKLTIYEITH